MNIYSELTKIGLKKILVYKGIIVINILKNLIYVFLQYSLWVAIKNNSSLDINIGNVIVYFLISRGISSINYNVSSLMSQDVKNGKIITILTKPLPIHEYYFFDILGNTIAKILTILLINTVLALFFIDNITIIFLIQFLILVMFSYVLNFVIELIFGTLSFFTQSIWGIESLKSVFILIFSGSFFPLYYYPKWFLKINDFLPFAYIYGKVSNFVLFRNDFMKIAIFQIVFIVILFYVYKLLLKVCLNKLSVNGG